MSRDCNLVWRIVPKETKFGTFNYKLLRALNVNVLFISGIRFTL